MASSTDNVKLGVCNVYFDDVDLGYTKGGVEVEVATTTHEVTVDQFGNTPISELVTGRTVSVSVPMAETTLENLMAIMPGSEFRTDGAKAIGSVVFSDVPTADDTVTIGTTAFTFKAAPAADGEVAIGLSIEAAATNLKNAINLAAAGVTAKLTPVAGEVTLTANVMGAAGTIAVSKIGTDIVVTGLAGALEPTYAYVAVSSGININLLSTARKLVLRPKGTSGEDDLVIFRAACPGAMSFAYQHDAERVFQASFKGYIREDGMMFALGNVGAHA